MRSVNTYRPLRFVCCYILYAMTLNACSTAPTTEYAAPAAAMPVSDSPKNAANEITLYDDLGGTDGIEQLATIFVKELAADERTRRHYAKSDIGRFHRMMQLQICELADGPCVYTGDSMKRTHGGMNITSTEFNALVEALMRAMDTIGLNPGVQNRLLATMTPMRSDIVGQ